MKILLMIAQTPVERLSIATKHPRNLDTKGVSKFHSEQPCYYFFFHKCLLRREGRCRERVHLVDANNTLHSKAPPMAVLLVILSDHRKYRAGARTVVFCPYPPAAHLPPSLYLRTDLILSHCHRDDEGEQPPKRMSKRIDYEAERIPPKGKTNLLAWRTSIVPSISMAGFAYTIPLWFGHLLVELAYRCRYLHYLKETSRCRAHTQDFCV
mmetsp:Transcript_6330/g.15753  ORF Transcript_6330/g.15753 Transcript_6330/m.15753 type:complete len:210 (-) Transcript_6330:16-645(-)